MPEEYRNSTYMEFTEVESRGQMREWMDWLYALGIPAQQVDHKGWVARDPYRNTVSVKTLLWKPDGPQPEMIDRAAACIAYPDYGSGEAQYGVMTVQLDETPPPFPAPYFDKEEAETRARRSLASLWSKLAKVGDLADDDRPRVGELQPAIDRIERLLDQIDAQRAERDGTVRAGLTWTDLDLHQGL